MNPLSRNPGSAPVYIHITLTLFILMDYLLHIDAISMDLSILYFKGSQVEISISSYQTMKGLALMKCYLKGHYIRVFHQRLQCLPKYLFTGIQNELG